MRAMVALPLLALALASAAPAALANAGSVRDASEHRQGFLAKLGNLRRERGYATGRRDWCQATIRFFKEQRQRLRSGEEVELQFMNTEYFRQPSVEEWTGAIVVGLFTARSSPSERKDFVRTTVRQYLSFKRGMERICDMHISGRSRELPELNTKIRKLDGEIRKAEAELLRWDGVAEALIASLIFGSEALLFQPLSPSGHGAGVSAEGELRRAGRRVYRGPLPLDVLFSWAKLRGQSRLVTLVIDTTKGTATISPKEHVDRTPMPGLVGHRTVAFTPGRVDGTGVARGRWIYVHRGGNLRQQHVPPRLTHTIGREADWRAQPVPGTDGRAYDLFVEATKRVPRRRLCRLNLVE